jgi:hypothetical protein
MVSSKLFPNRALFTYEIEEKYKDEQRVAGVFSDSKCPVLKPNKIYFILLHKPTQTSGHYQLISTTKNTSYFFDPFGVIYPDGVCLKRMKQFSPKTYANDFQYQNITSSRCGWYCVYVADLLLKGYTFEEIMENEMNKIAENKEKS